MVTHAAPSTFMDESAGGRLYNGGWHGLGVISGAIIIYYKFPYSFHIFLIALVDKTYHFIHVLIKFMIFLVGWPIFHILGSPGRPAGRISFFEGPRAPSGSGRTAPGGAPQKRNLAPNRKNRASTRKNRDLNRNIYKMTGFRYKTYQRVWGTIRNGWE